MMLRYMSFALLSTILLFPATGHTQTTNEVEYMVGYATRGSETYSFAEYHFAQPYTYNSYTVMDITLASEIPVWSTDGLRVALVHRPLAFYSVSGYYPQVISLINADGVYQDTILQPQSYVRKVRWSPDGTQLAFLSAPVTDVVIETLEIVNVDGTNRHKLLPAEHDAQNIFSITWSPDSSQIAYLSGDSHENMLSLVNRDGSDLRVMADRLSVDPSNAYLNWTADQQYIILLGQLLSSTQTNLLKIDRETGEVQRLLEDEISIAGFDIASDGQHVVILTWDKQLKIYDLTSGNIQFETEIGQYEPSYGAPQWSPDDRFIAFSAIAKDGVPAQIFILNIAEEELLMLSLASTDAIYPHWLPAKDSPFNQ